MSDINFDCPHCNQNLDAPSDMGGDSIECPACENSIVIPAPKKMAPAKGKKIVMKKRGGTSPRSTATRPRTQKKTAPKSKPATSPATDPETADSKSDVSEKKRLVALLLNMFLGGLSIHRFYVGKTGTAILQIVTAGGLGVWLLIDFIMILCGTFKDKQGLPLTNW